MTQASAVRRLGDWSGERLRSLAAEYGTPLYVTDLDRVRENARRLQTTFDEEEVKTMLTVPYSMKVVMLLLIGHPGEPVEREQRMPTNRVVSYNHW